MLIRWIALLGLAATLAACAHSPAGQDARAMPWNGGIWNSVLGYHGPGNEIVTGGPG